MPARTRCYLTFTHRVLLAELLGQSLLRLKERRIVHAAASGRDLMLWSRSRAPDVVFLDPGHPEADVFGLAQSLSRLTPRPRIIFLAETAAKGWIRRALAAGADAYLDHGATLADLLRAVRAVLDGKSFFSPAAAQVVASFATGVDGALTDRELQVLRLICEGRSSKEIARFLGLSPKSVDAHRARLIEKAGVASSTALVRYACAQRYVDLRCPERQTAPERRARRHPEMTARPPKPEQAGN